MSVMNNDNRKTIALVCTALHEVGGETHHHLNLYNTLDSAKYRVILVFCAHQKDAVIKYFLDGGVKQEDIFHFPTSKIYLFVPLVFRLRRVFIEQSVDIIHTFFLHSDILGCIAAILAGKRSRISNIEGKIVLDEAHGVGKIKQTCYFIINQMIRPFFFKTICVSEGLREELITYHRIPRSKTEVIHIGIKVPSDQELNHDSNVHKAEKIIATASRFSPDKRLEYILKAVPDVTKHLPEVKFVIAGTGSEEANLKQMASEMGIESNVVFPGWIKDIKSFMLVIDVFVMTSVREGCPIPMLEAMSYVKPVVAFRAPGIQEIISHEEDGVLIEELNVEKFTSAILKICENADYARKLGTKGRQKVMERNKRRQ